MSCLRQPAPAYPAHLSHADGAVTNEKRDSFDDVAKNLPDFRLPPQAEFWHESHALIRCATIFLTTLIPVFSGITSFTYNFDGIGRRAEFPNNAANALNQFVAIEHPLVPKKLYISAEPDARLWVNGTEMTPFEGGWIYQLAHPGAAGGWVPWHVKGVLEGAGDPGAFPDAVAEFGGDVFFPPTSETFTFDADGNRESSSLWNYGWDGRNHLVRARTKTWNTAPEGWDVQFEYDAEGRRFKKHVTRYKNGAAVEQKVITFVWDGWDLLYERHEDIHGNFLLDRKYIWGPDIADGAAGGAGGLLLIREKRGTTTSDYYPIYDGTGHVTGITDSTGKLVAEYWYGPFGELIEAKGEMAHLNPWRYATKYFDTETGLYYFGLRYYDPATGQWMNREPLGEDESLNLNSYCHNDPINKVDRLGLDAVTFEFEGASDMVAYFHLEDWKQSREWTDRLLPWKRWIKSKKMKIRLGPINAVNENEWLIQLEPWVAGPGQEVNFFDLAVIAGEKGRYRADCGDDTFYHHKVIQRLYASNWKPVGNPGDYLAGAVDRVFAPATAAANLLSGPGGGAYTISGALRRDGYVDFNENTFLYDAGGQTTEAAEYATLFLGLSKQAVGRPLVMMDDFACLSVRPPMLPVAPNRLATNADEAVFWSGLGRGGDKKALAWINNNGGATLESTLASRGIKLPAWNASDPTVVAAWQKASVDFANGAKGHVRVLQGDSLRVDAIFGAEFRALQANPSVKSVISINPETGAEVLLWTR